MDDRTVHLLLEMLAYAVGARVYWQTARPRYSHFQTLALLSGAIFGAFVGSKLLHLAEHLPAVIQRADPATWLAGKSLLGGLLGGTLGVEIAKKVAGVTLPTGDAWVPALWIGIVIGRVGCQFSGTWDLTYGTPTSLPIAWDYGDGIGRHPTALYEIVGISVAYWLVSRSPLLHARGARFAAFLLSYCLLRFFLEFLKPPFGPAALGSLPAATYAGLTAIQWAAIAGAIYFAWSLRRRTRAPETNVVMITPNA